MASAVVIGSTGLVGSHILSTLLALPSTSSITTITRRAPKATSPKLNALVEETNTSWSSKLSGLESTPEIYFSALGTTRAAAGGIENQRKIDVDLNVAVAKAAAEKGVKICVLVSSSGASATSRIPYSQMKGELEDSVSALPFSHVVILRPGLIVGAREETRAAEGIMRGIAGFMGGIRPGLKDFWAQDADVIAKAGVHAGLLAAKGEQKEKVVILGQSDIVRLGRTDWKDGA